MMLNFSSLIDLLLNLVFYFTIGLFGAFMKDLYETIIKKDAKIKLSRIIISSTWTSFLFLSLESNVLVGVDIGIITFLVFLNGIIGFELFGKISTLSGLSGIIDNIKLFKQTFEELKGKKI